MALPPIQISLTNFEQLEILRDEIETRTEELKETEKQIRAALYDKARIEYLRSQHPIFQQLEEPPALAQLDQYQAYRDALSEAIGRMRESLKALEAETRGQQAPPGTQAPSARPGIPPPAAGRRAAKFDDFDAFKNARGPGR